MPKRLKSHVLTVKTDLAEPGKTLTQAVVSDLMKLIGRGDVDIGELLPPERQLAATYNVSRVTIRAALKGLVRYGMLDRRPAVGYVVSKREPNNLQTAPVALIYRDFHQLGSGTSKSVPAIENELAKNGRALLIGSSGLDGEREDACIQRFRAAGVGGLVVSPATQGKHSRELETWIKEGKPVVLEGHPCSWLLPDKLAEQCDQIDIDNEVGIREAVRYLVGLGHTSFGFLLAGSGAHSERYEVFRNVMAEQGPSLQDEWIHLDLESGGAGGATGYALLHETGHMPTAVICGDDDTASGFINAAQADGLVCPDKVSVVGFGNESSEGSKASESLTTIDYSREELAREIVRLMNKTPLNERHPEKIRLAPKLLVRTSCGVPGN